MPLQCPFCHADEDERIEGDDENGNKVILVMFNCPFYFRFYPEELDNDGKMQAILDKWRSENGEEWLESVGPIMKLRELKNIERFDSSSKTKNDVSELRT